MSPENEKLALFRKYRPKDFGDLVGQDHVQKTIMNALKKGRASHAYLFSGPRGTGKTSTARLVAKGLICPELLENPDAVSQAWEDIQAGRHLDLIEIDAASNRGIDEIRDLRDKVRFSPSQGAKKVFIIDEVHMLTTEAFNALLKTLEEPPDHAHFVLATTELHKVPATIISRCQHFEFRRIPENIIQSRLEEVVEKEGISIEKDALPILAHTSQGGMRDALVLLEQVASSDQKTTVKDVQEMLGIVHADAISDFLIALFNGDAGKALELIHNVYGRGGDLISFTKDLISAMRQRLVENVSSGNVSAVPFEIRAIRSFEQVLIDIKIASIPELPLEMAVIELVKPGNNTGTYLSPTPVSKPVSAPAPQTAPRSELAPTPTPSEPSPGQSDIPSSAPASGGAPSTETGAIDSSPTPEAASPDPALPESPDSDYSSSSSNISIEDSWNQVLATIKSPTVRLAARKAELSMPDQETLVMGIVAKFELEKVSNDKATHEIEEAILSVTGRRVKIVPEHRSAPEKPAEPNNVPVDNLEEFFGGTAIE